MDARKVIYEVKKRRPLWDLFDKKNYDKMLIIKLWEEIAEELDLPTNEIKKRWKNLRDTYRIVLKRERRAILSGCSSSGKPWKYTEEMAFLKDVMTTDPLRGARINCSGFEYNFDHTNTSQDESLDELLSTNSKRNNDLKNEINDGELSECSFPDSNEPPIPQKKKRIFPDLKKVREREKIEQVEKRLSLKKTSEDKMDGDYNFLLSFLPIMREMTSIQKLEFRAQMSNVTLNIMRPSTSANHDIGFEDPSTSSVKHNWK